MTPPGSPGTNQSSLTGNDQQQIHKQIFLSTLINNEEQSHRHKFEVITKFFKFFYNVFFKKSESNSITNEELFKKFGSMLGLPEKQILTFFGVDLKKYADLQFDELLATFRESLTKHLSEKEKKKETSSKRFFLIILKICFKAQRHRVIILSNYSNLLIVNNKNL